MTVSVDNQPLVSIAIISYNRKDALRRCVQAARDQTYSNTEILIIDNDSVDGGWQEVQKEFPDVRVIRMHRNIGWPMAKNVASANVHGEFIYFLDDDLYLFPDAVEKAVNLLLKRPEILLVSGQFVDIYTHQCYRMSIWGKCKCIPPATYTATIYGGHALWRADGLRKVGYYPEHSTYGGLDAYVGQKALDMGYLVYWSPDILGYHEGHKGGRDNARNFRQVMTNRIHVAWMLHPLLYATTGTILSICRYAVVAFKRRLIKPYISALIRFPSAIINGLRCREPIRRSTMRLFFALRKHRPATIEELMRICPEHHPVWETCRRVITGQSV